MLNIAVLVSGGGTNLQAMIDAQQAGRIPNGQIRVVISSKPGVCALERAARHGIESLVLSPRDFAGQDEFDRRLIQELESRDIDLVVLAGYLCILSPTVTKHFDRRIINVHPSLIPAFCGPGYYGLRVHQAALDYGVKVTGATVHFVNEVPDGGEILLQKAVYVLPGETPESLQRRVMEQAEWELLPKAVALFCEGKIR